MYVCVCAGPASRLQTVSTPPTAKDRRLLDFINKIRRYGTGWQPIRHIVEEPLFLDSSESAGLQIADAVAYCITNTIKENCDFDSYWNMIYEKAQKIQTMTLVAMDYASFQDYKA